MSEEKLQILCRHDFPSHPFFGHLRKGTENFQKRNFERAIEEWSAANRVRYDKPTKLGRFEGKICFGCVLKEIPFLFFLFTIYRNKANGIGIIRTKEVTKKLSFENGRLVNANTSTPDERIGKFILKRKDLGADSLDKLVEEAKAEGLRIGEYLVKIGYLSINELYEILSLQIEEILSNILFWSNAKSYFIEKQITKDRIVNYDPLDVALLAALREFRFTDFRNRISNNKMIFRPSPYVEENKDTIIKDLNINCQFIFSLIDGTRNIDQLLKYSGADEVSVINILYQLSAKGLVRRTREVVEYEDKEFGEISKMIGVLFEIHKIIASELYQELGERGEDLIQKAKANLKEVYQKLFLNISLGNPANLNKQMILRNIARYSPTPDQRTMFIDAFFELFKNMLTELEKFLGTRLIEKTIEKIRGEIVKVEIFASETSLKNRLLDALTELVR